MVWSNGLFLFGGGGGFGPWLVGFPKRSPPPPMAKNPSPLGGPFCSLQNWVQKWVENWFASRDEMIFPIGFGSVAKKAFLLRFDPVGEGVSHEFWARGLKCWDLSRCQRGVSQSVFAQGQKTINCTGVARDYDTKAFWPGFYSDLTLG